MSQCTVGLAMQRAVLARVDSPLLIQPGVRDGLVDVRFANTVESQRVLAQGIGRVVHNGIPNMVRYAIIFEAAHANELAADRIDALLAQSTE